MGAEVSQEDFNRGAVALYETALGNTCLLPDVGIDEPLLRYSGIDSNAQLQAFSDLQVNIVPGYIEKLGTGLASLSVIPNAVGLGAMVISLIVDLIIKGTSQTDHTYEMLRRVFGEEKASAVRDTMSEYLKRHRIFMNNERQLREELQRLETQLSNHLTILQNSLLHDGQMSTRGFKIWVNGASFHVQMMIHKARLSVESGEHQSDYINSIAAAIDLYLMNLEHLIEKFKTFKFSKTATLPFSPMECGIQDTETSCIVSHVNTVNFFPCERQVIKAYLNHVFSTYEPLSGLRSHFSNMKTNLNAMINQHASFTVPSAAEPSYFDKYN